MRLWPVPYDEWDISSRFGSTHLVACGPKDARPLLLLHCFLTSLTVWAHNVSALSRRYRVYAPDMMGQPGKSIPDQSIGNRDDMADWVSGILDHLALRQTHLAGYSYGGFAALNYAMHAPDRVEKLIVLSPAGGLVPLKTQFYVRGALNTLAARLPGIDRLSMKIIFRWMFYAPNLTKPEMRPLAECMLNQMFLGNKYFRIGPMVLPTVYKDEELRRIRTPTLLLIGEKEALYDARSALIRARQLIPDIRAELMREAGHDLPVSQAQTVNQKILEFLNGQCQRFGACANGNP